MMMLFLRDVPDKARAGEVRRVSRGYARNYLLPKGLAEIATDETLKRLEKVKQEGDVQVRARETHVVEELAEALDNLTVTIPGRVTPYRPVLRRHQRRSNLRCLGRIAGEGNRPAHHQRSGTDPRTR